MNTKEVKNVVASVLAKLRNTSKSNGVPFQQVLQQYAMERFLYRVSKSRHAQSVSLRLQIDFGVGDVIVPGPKMIEYPVFLGGDMIQLLAYPVESAVAGKLQAMVALGSANSRRRASQGRQRDVQESRNITPGARV